MFRAGIITVSDKGSQGKREDKSGPVIAEMLAGAAVSIVETVIIPDEVEQIAAALIRMADEEKLDLILTTGGTGVSPRDLTPDATRQVLDKEIPGLACGVIFMLAARMASASPGISLDRKSVV